MSVDGPIHQGIENARLKDSTKEEFSSAVQIQRERIRKSDILIVLLKMWLVR